MLMPLLVLSSLALPALADGVLISETDDDANEPIKDVLGLNCKSAILMEASTGRVLYEQNADEALPPASVTKIMTLLLVMEAIENGKLSFETEVTASEYACSMGGSQIWLEPGEMYHQTRVHTHKVNCKG